MFAVVRRHPAGGLRQLHPRRRHQPCARAATAFKLCVFNRWTAGFGQFRETLRFIAPDQTTVLRQGEMKFALQEVTHNATTITVWGQVKFEIAGAYYVEVMVDDVMKLRFPLVISVAPPGPPAEGGTRQGP
jgi:hypothetical protein